MKVGKILAKQFSYESCYWLSQENATTNGKLKCLYIASAGTSAGKTSRIIAAITTAMTLCTEQTHVRFFFHYLFLGRGMANGKKALREEVVESEGEEKGKGGRDWQEMGFCFCCFPYDSSLLLPQICSALPPIVSMLLRLCHIDKGSKGPVEGTISIPSILTPLPRGGDNIDGD